MADKAIFVPDYKQLLNDLKTLSPDLQKDFLKSLKRVIRPVQRTARGFVPGDPALSGWRTVEPTYTSSRWIDDTKHRGRASNVRWVWDSAKMRKGIKIKTSTSSQERAAVKLAGSIGGKYKITAIALRNQSVPGIIYELAEPDTPRKGADMKSRNPNAPDDFRRGIARKGDHGHRPRLIYKAARIHGNKVQDEIVDVLDKKLFAFVKRGD